MANRQRRGAIAARQQGGRWPKTTKTRSWSSSTRKTYERELAKLQLELVKLQEWVRHQGLKVVVIFEGRDAAGKDGTIKRITEVLNPRVVRVVALPTPTEREKTEWYFQRYVAAPAGRRRDRPVRPQLVQPRRRRARARLLHRRRGAGVLPLLPGVRAHADALRHHRSSSTGSRVSDEEQEKRFQERIDDPLKRWKFSEMDLESRDRWEDYSRAKDEMFAFTDTKQSPWYVVEADDKKRARLNCIHHLLSMIPYEDVLPKPFKLPPRKPEQGLRAAADERADVRAAGVLSVRVAQPERAPRSGRCRAAGSARTRACARGRWHGRARRS